MRRTDANDDQRGFVRRGSAQDEPCAVDADCGVNGKCAKAEERILASCENTKIKRCAGTLKQCVAPTFETEKHDPTIFKTCKENVDCEKESGGKTACRSVQDFVRQMFIRCPMFAANNTGHMSGISYGSHSHVQHVRVQPVFVYQLVGLRGS